jgi:hypothetical protein
MMWCSIPGMRTLIVSAASVAMMGVALAQVPASSSSTYLLDIDPARYSGPAGQRLALRVGDQPRYVNIGTQDEMCVQLQRVDGENEVINAVVRTTQPKQVARVRVVAPDISPGTYRSTPWGLLLRALPHNVEPTTAAKPISTDDAPVCTLDAPARPPSLAAGR